MWPEVVVFAVSIVPVVQNRTSSTTYILNSITFL